MHDIAASCSASDGRVEFIGEEQHHPERHHFFGVKNMEDHLAESKPPQRPAQSMIKRHSRTEQPQHQNQLDDDDRGPTPQISDQRLHDVMETFEYKAQSKVRNMAGLFMQLYKLGVMKSHEIETTAATPRKMLSLGEFRAVLDGIGMPMKKEETRVLFHKFKSKGGKTVRCD